MGSDEVAVKNPAEKEKADLKRKTPSTKEDTSKSKVNQETIDDNEDEDEDEDAEDYADEAEDNDEGDEDEGDSEEDMAPKTKKRRTDDSDSNHSGDESEPELKMTEDDLVGVDTSNIIPRSRRRAAVAAMALASEEIAASEGVAPAATSKGNDENDGNSSDEAEF